MAGSLKVTCPNPDTVYAYNSVASATLSSATSWTIAFFYQFVSWETGFAGDIIQIGNPPFVMRAGGGGTLSIYASSVDGKTIGKTVNADTSGHHVCISGSSTGTSTIYIDGIAAATTAALGALTASNATNYFGKSSDSKAATLYLSDVAIWGSYPASFGDAFNLATRVYTPANLPGHPATNYWTLQGTAGPVSAPLVDSLGSVNLNTINGVAADLTYDAHVITATPIVSVFFMTPYVDTTGYLLFIPLYLNPDITAGGPLPAYDDVTVNTDPIFTVAGTPVTVTLLPHDPQCSFIAYQFSTPVTAGQVVTMSAPVGWASTTSGTVGGTSAAGLGSAPVTCLNYAGTSRDSAVVTPTCKAAWNVGGGSAGSPAQIMRNWVRRIASNVPSIPGTPNWGGTGSATSFDVNNLPASFTGGSGAYIYSALASLAVNDGCAIALPFLGTPDMQGTWTLIHGDATPGVDASTKKLVIDLTVFTVGWTVTLLDVVHAGDWDPSYTTGGATGAWHKIIKTYAITWSPTGGDLRSAPLLQIARTDNVGGAVVIPILANGQSELGLFEPSVADPTIPATIPTNYLDLFDVLAVSPLWLDKFAGAHAIRWMPNQILFTSSGSGPLIYPADLDIRKSTDFLSTNHSVLTLNITRIDPVSTSTPTQVIVDYINGDSTGTLPISLTPTHPNNIFCIATTESPHGARVGDNPTLYWPSGPTARAAVSDSAYITLTANIDAGQTTIPVSAFTNINGDGGCTIFNGAVFQLGPLTTDEQVEVTGGDPTSTNITVIRGTRGTTALAKPSGTVVYPASDLNVGGANNPPFAISPTQLFGVLANRAVPRNAPRTPTLLYAQTYSSGNCPVFTTGNVPQFGGTSSYELCAHATGLVAAANPDGVCICWVNIPFFATDAAITACVNKMTADFLANPGLQLIVQVDNEMFNAFFYQHSLAVTLCEVAPNPENPLVHFVDWYDYTASRQHHFNMTARAAFTAAGLDPDRVVWFQGGGGNLISVQGAIAYCQRYSLPISSYAISFYADMNQLSPDLQNVYVSWIPASTGVPGATAPWDLATARAIMGSNYRASFRFGGIGASTGNVTIAQYLSRYNHGVSVDGVAPANTNPVPGLLCGYEGATTQPLPWNFPAFYPGDQNSPGIFPMVGAWTMAMQYDPEWYRTEWDFYQANQDGAYQYALLMGSKFPHPEDAIMEFACYFEIVGTDFPIGENQAYMYSSWRWQQQKSGYGDGSHGGVVNNLDFWNPLGGVVSLTGAIDAVQTVIPLSAIEGIIPGATLDIDPSGPNRFERVNVVSIAGLDVTVTRGQNSTAAAAKPSGTLVYPQVLGINQDMHANGGILPPTINESVRGQVAKDWIAALPTPTPTPALTGDGAILLAGM